MNRDLELKKEIINWLIENKNVWQRVNECSEHFKNYIYNEDGNYLIGGKEVMEFIKKADILLFREDF